MKIFIVDDHYIVRQGLIDILKSEGMDVIGTAKDAEEALQLVFENNPDIVIVDLNLSPKMTGIELIEILLQIRSNAKIIVFSMREALPAISAAYRAGAMAYVAKSSDPSTLFEAIESVFNGNLYFMPGLAEKLAASHLRGDPRDPRQLLNDKEFAIFLGTAKGVGVKEVAESLGLSPKSITNRLVSIRKKLECTSSHDLTRIALRYGLINDQQSSDLS